MKFALFLQQKKISAVSLVIGIILLIINLPGVYFSLRNEKIYSLKTKFENDVILSDKEAIRIIKSVPATEEGIENILKAVQNSMAYYWQKEESDDFYLRVPWWENYILFSAGYISPSIYEKYEFCNYKKAIERGVGLCSQQAIAFADALEKKRIGVELVKLNKHIITRVLVNQKDSRWWMVDVDWGVIIKEDIETIGKNSDLILNYYIDSRYGRNELDEIEKAYAGSETYKIFPGGVKGYTDCNWKKYYLEKYSYYLIWILPVLLILWPIVKFFYFYRKDGE